MTMPQVRRSTAVLIVDAIEPSLPFWQERLGFARPVEVAHDDRLGFVILTNGSIEVMYQTVDSVRADSAAHGSEFDRDRTFLYVEVDDIEALSAALDGFDIVMPRRETFYGATEIGYREPGGHFVTFAQLKT